MNPYSECRIQTRFTKEVEKHVQREQGDADERQCPLLILRGISYEI